MSEARARHRLLFWRSWSKRVSKAEKVILGVVRTYLKDASKRYAKRAKRIAEDQRKKNKSKDPLGSKTEMELFVRSFGKAIESLWILTGNDELDDLYKITNRERPLDLQFGARRILEKEILAKTTKKVIKTTEKKVKAKIKEGIEQGLTNDEIAKTVKEASAFSFGRARMIAQTETTKAINRATNESYVLFAKTEKITVMKEWIASQDDKTRPSHFNLDNTVIDANEDFQIEGYTAPAPASFGVPRHDINCRCTIAPVVNL